MGRSALFPATAVAVPFAAFPILTAAGWPADAATLFAAVLLLVSPPFRRALDGKILRDLWIPEQVLSFSEDSPA